ncbi:glutamic acid-rich protein [Laccaria bicolor S238N-H82]|uniref:Glutamic acid-rich protein n=1 Tax=Laccaria bicolor (strain S238N-H82 / ATCC MYA-4686) TaxID=486041 RepID=B0DD01_LACBS|nr:glutamic acid-rich protein [Laccaria bicolor S238N-H82]EDR07527.1 glutamic acid-rich protein [Laccaria bicolor S238N-H82]|eukprot:XP_001881919.1 glutamic acid-rich protein [Laccaria bicolor S238N-H82]
MSMAKWTSQLEKSHAKLAKSTSDLTTLRNKASKLCKAVKCGKKQKEQSIASVKKKILDQRSVHYLMQKGVFTEETRNVVCLLVKAGCSRNLVGEVILAVLKSAGITGVGSISRTSVSRFLHEGYFAAQIQLGYEMKKAESMTFSADGTSHRSINYNSRHVHLIAEDYTSPEGSSKQQVTRTFGIQSSKDGSSEEAIADWENTLKKIIDLYNNSPLGKRSGGLLKFFELLIKLAGMSTDHCAKEKKDAGLLETLKAWAVDQHLGEEKMLEMTLEEVRDYFKKAEEEMIRKAGGVNKWNKLSDIKKAERKAKMIEEAVAELGKEEFDNLSDEEKHIFRLFIWAGCGCHKDLNTIRGGYLAVAAWWIENGLEEERPVLLANRDNDPVVQERATALEKGDTLTPAQERAFHKSTCGAIKTAEIAGAIFNNKDDKRGHHDIFRYWWWEHVGVPFTFPDTSNNRFQSYCNAAAALILYGDEFKDFLESLRINKQNPTLNHMELNLWKALHCTSTKIIANPDILIGKDLDISESYKTATLDGEKWQNPAVVKKIFDLIPTLPHFHNLLIAFFKGAAQTWECFTSEFAPGGLIDEATAEERELAHMPATNDENEGLLGSFRRLMHYQPQLTLLSCNALIMFFRNNTQAFMETKFTEEDYQYIHKLGREANGEEKKRRNELTDFRDQRQAKKTARKEVQEQNAKATAERIAQLELVFDKEKVPGLKGTSLKDQLRLFKSAGAPNLKQGPMPTKVADIRKALVDAIDLHTNGAWKLIQDEESEGENINLSEEEEDEEDEEDEEEGWEDIEGYESE